MFAVGKKNVKCLSTQAGASPYPARILSCHIHTTLTGLSRFLSQKHNHTQNSPEVDEDIDQAPVVHAVRPVVTPPLDQPILPVAPGKVVAHQQPALQRGERGGDEGQRPRWSKPVPPARPLVSQQLFQRGQRADLRLPEGLLGAGGRFQRRPWLQDSSLANTGAGFAARTLSCAVLVRRSLSALPAVPREQGASGRQGGIVGVGGLHPPRGLRIPSVCSTRCQTGLEHRKTPSGQYRARRAGFAAPGLPDNSPVGRPLQAGGVGRSSAE